MKIKIAKFYLFNSQQYIEIEGAHRQELENFENMHTDKNMDKGKNLFDQGYKYFKKLRSYFKSVCSNIKNKVK